LFHKKKTRKNRSKVSRKKFRQRRLFHLRALFQGMLFITGVALMSIMFILGHDMITQGNLFNAKRIEVSGNHRVSKEEVLRLAQVTPQMNIFSLNLNVARKQLLSNGWVADAKVRRELPDGIVIHIEENEPVALLDLGRSYVIDRAGVIIKEWEATDKNDLLRVTGLDYSDILTDSCRPSDSMDDFLDLIKALQSENSTMPFQTLSRIHVDRDVGLTLYAQGLIKTVNFGFKNYDKKLQRLCVILNYLERQKEILSFNSVDLANENNIVAVPLWEEKTPDKTIRRS
jgi:cell division protein FtsQ